jgi:propionate CoA-transferase
VFTTESNISIREGIKRLRFISGMLGITPKRTPTDDTVARLGASLFAQHAHKGDYVNIGVGLPEEVCRVIYQGGLVDEITLLTETGVLGGLPASGVFFGAGICPKKIISSCEVFKLCYEKLDVTILGALQVDSQGNVNVSKRGEELVNYVGPGGFIDLTTAAKMIIFVSSWMARAEIKVEQDRVSIARPGIPKFVDRVDEVTFNGAEALKRGKKVFYVTNVGAFRLTERGMELIAVMPGIDVQRDIVSGCPMRVVLPESGKVPIVDDAIVSGKKFKLQLGAGTF